MFLGLQLPLTDARPFVPEQTFRLPRPAWPPTLYGEHIHGFGSIRSHTSNAIGPWLGDHRYCSAKHAMKFEAPLASWSFAGLTGFECTFRRLCGGLAPFQSPGHSPRAVCNFRFEVGLDRNLRARYRRIEEQVLSGGVFRLVDALLRLPVRLPNSSPTALASFGPRLATYLLRATTSKDHPNEFQVPQWWVSARQPVVLIEYVAEEISSIPDACTEIQVSDNGLRLHHYNAQTLGTESHVWLLGRDRYSDRDAAKRLRVHLLRLHSEREHLLALFGLLSSGRLEIRAEHPGSSTLQDYLEQTLDFLQRGHAYGHDQDDLYAAAYEADSRFNDDDYRLLIGGLRGMREPLLDKIINSRFGGGESTGVEPRTVIVVGRYEDYSRNVGGNYVEEEIKVKAGGDIIASQFGSHNTQKISDSFNTFAAEHGKNDDLFDQMQSLSENITALVAQLEVQDPNAAKEVSETFQSFAEESAKEAPKTGTLRALGRGLVDAAKKVAKVAVPVATTVAAVLAIFGVVL